MQQQKKVRLYDTYQGKVIEFRPLVPGEASVYYCGPTVYNHVHIGNLRPVITFDLLARVLRAAGYRVHMISNYTDIDDRIINKALEEGISEKALSDRYIKAYEDVLSKLNLLKLENHPRVSDYIPQIVDFVQAIIDKGYAYKTEGGDVYFSVGDDPYYGTLSKIRPDDLIAGSRVEPGQDKRSPLDFALWKDTDDKGIKFDTRLGKGRPGWHTECAVMINSYFGKPLIDIHGGGFDLRFPHHENEMAQSWAYAGTRLADVWMHVGFVNINNVKMSKSLGNTVLAKDAIAAYGSNALRHFFLTTYYRSPVNYTDESLRTSLIETDKYGRLLHAFEAKSALAGIAYGNGYDMKAYDVFLGYLCDDLNVSNALTVLERTMKSANALLHSGKADPDGLSVSYNTYVKMLDTLGFSFEPLQITDEDKADYRAYLKAHEARDYTMSDKLRTKLLAKGIL